MKYLDTNILVRLITNDQPESTAKAVQIINEAKKGSLAIHDAVLVELCFVLEFSRYKMTREDIYQALTSLLDLPQIAVTDQMSAALELYGRHKKLDYTDCILLEISNSSQHEIMTMGKILKEVIDRK